ncbi:MAG: Rqc2 family fibronectin-binding protein [Bacilli bacterium]
MFFDGLWLRAMTDDIRPALVGGRVSKLFQPTQHEIVVVVRNHHATNELVLSAHPTYCGVYLRTKSVENPAEPPGFCQRARKLLNGAIVTAVEQLQNDRILMIHFRGTDELGDTVHYTLVLECMGKHSNIVLMDKTSSRVLDCIKYVSLSQSTRAMYPGVTYSPFISEEVNPFLWLAGTENEPERFQGIGRLFREAIIREATTTARPSADVLREYLARIVAGDTAPCLITYRNRTAFSLFPFDFEQIPSVGSLSNVIESYITRVYTVDRNRERTANLVLWLTNEKKKRERKIGHLHDDLARTEHMDKWRLYGELLTIDMYRIQKGMTMVRVQNYYSEQADEMVDIPLDPKRTPTENAQSYFQKYTKIKNSVSYIEEQLRITQEEIVYFETLMHQLDYARAGEIDQIRRELEEQGYLRPQSRTRSRNVKQTISAERFYSSDGTEILVGHNNLQNDWLTFKQASRNDIWLHVKHHPGSHVIIRASEPSDETLRQAAEIAAWFSSVRHATNVSVDYTAVRYVKKPQGAKPGFVIYTHERTAVVDSVDPSIRKQHPNGNTE